MLLDATQRALFAEHGWLVVRAAVSRQRASELEHALEESTRFWFPIVYRTCV